MTVITKQKISKLQWFNLFRRPTIGSKDNVFKRKIYRSQTFYYRVIDRVRYLSFARIVIIIIIIVY